MARGTKGLVWSAVAAGIAAGGFLIYFVSRPPKVRYLTGAVLREDSDPNKQRPVANAKIAVASGRASGATVSGPAGYFRLQLASPVEPGTPLLITVEHPDYRSLKISEPADDKIQLVRLTPLRSDTEKIPSGRSTPVANVRVRYAVTNTSTVDVGSMARTFRIDNTPSLPCDGRPPCSPDGKWKATVRTISLDAGQGRQFRNVRVSCIAGPCPFSHIESDDFSRGGKVIRFVIRNWSDSVAYLVEAEVANTMVGDMIRHSYPAIFGRSMTFSLPATARGPSIEAEVGGAEIVYPLGPQLHLSWAACRVEDGADGAKLYRCELEPQYAFK